MSEYLTEKFGKGFSVGNLKNIRQFYKSYVSDPIGETVFCQFENLPYMGTGRKFCLSWSHYLKLMHVDNVDERHFYEIGAAETLLGSHTSKPYNPDIVRVFYLAGYIESWGRGIQKIAMPVKFRC